MNKTLIALIVACTPVFAQPGAMPQQPDLEQLFFKQFDRNNDHKVSKDEFLEPTIAQFEHMDRNHDGMLDRGEVEAFNQEMQQRMQEMRQRLQQQMPQGMPRR